MTEQEMKALIGEVVTPLLDKSADYEKQISELNEEKATTSEQIEQLRKDKEAAELNASQKDEALTSKDEEIKKLNEELDSCKAELNELRKSERKAELNRVLSKYTAEQQKLVASEVNSFNEDPLNGDIEKIENKICFKIVEQQLKNKNSEINTLLDDKYVEDTYEDGADVNIFD